MVSYGTFGVCYASVGFVLILVVVDNGLVLISLMLQTASHTVLILVVVDNGLVPSAR